jgi:hypothetical protein
MLQNVVGMVTWWTLSRTPPVTATTDFLAPDILNRCGRAVPAPPSSLTGPCDRLRRDRHPSTLPATVRITSSPRHGPSHQRWGVRFWAQCRHRRSFAHAERAGVTATGQGASVEAIRRPDSAPPVQGYSNPGQAAPAHRRPRGTGAQPDQIKRCRAQPQLSPKGQDVKLGPNRARRGFASSPAQAANRQKPLIGRGFSSFPQGREIARLQVVWSWHPLLMSS